MFIATSIRSYFCDRASEEVDDSWVPTFKEARIVVPGALLLALVIVSLLPLPAPRSAITSRIDEATSLTARKASGEDEQRVTDMARQYVPNALGTRQLRIALAYAILSGLASGKSLGQTLQDLGLNDRESKDARKRAEQEIKAARKNE